MLNNKYIKRFKDNNYSLVYYFGFDNFIVSDIGFNMYYRAINKRLFGIRLRKIKYGK
jgi:hypothetical protein